MKASSLLLLITLFFIGCTSEEQKQSRVDALPYYNDPAFTPQWLSADDEVLKDFHYIPTFAFINQEGDTITDKNLDGKIYVVDFFFTTCPGICLKMTSNMGIVQEAFMDDDEVMLLSHSVTPDIDSVPILKSYAERKGVHTNKWHLLTGERKAIYNLGRNYYFVEEDLGINKDESDFLHTENFVLIDQNKHIRGIYSGLNKTAIAQLIADIKTLQQGG